MDNLAKTIGQFIIVVLVLGVLAICSPFALIVGVDEYQQLQQRIERQKVAPLVLPDFTSQVHTSEQQSESIANFNEVSPETLLADTTVFYVAGTAEQQSLYQYPVDIPLKVKASYIDLVEPDTFLLNHNLFGEKSLLQMHLPDLTETKLLTANDYENIFNQIATTENENGYYTQGYTASDLRVGDFLRIQDTDAIVFSTILRKFQRRAEFYDISNSDLWSLDLQTGKYYNLLFDENYTNLHISPDGRFIVLDYIFSAKLQLHALIEDHNNLFSLELVGEIGYEDYSFRCNTYDNGKTFYPQIEWSSPSTFNVVFSTLYSEGAARDCRAIAVEHLNVVKFSVDALRNQQEVLQLQPSSVKYPVWLLDNGGFGASKYETSVAWAPSHEHLFVQAQSSQFNLVTLDADLQPLQVWTHASMDSEFEYQMHGWSATGSGFSMGLLDEAEGVVALAYFSVDTQSAQTVTFTTPINPEQLVTTNDTTYFVYQADQNLIVIDLEQQLKTTLQINSLRNVEKIYFAPSK